MADDTSAEKRHEPGERKWREAAERGQIPRSADLAAAAVLASGAAALAWGSAPMARSLRELTVRFFDGGGPYEMDLAQAESISLAAIGAIGVSLAVPLGVIMIASVTAHLLQTRGRLAPKALEASWDRLDVARGFAERYLSWTPLVELGKGSTKLFAVTGVAVYASWTEITSFATLASLGPEQLLAMFVSLGWKVVATTLPLMLLIAAADYAYSWWRLNEQLKRTDQELRDDLRQTDGDPKIKAHRRRRARQMTGDVGLPSVAEADLLIASPPDSRRPG